MTLLKIFNINTRQQYPRKNFASASQIPSLNFRFCIPIVLTFILQALIASAALAQTAAEKNTSNASLPAVTEVVVEPRAEEELNSLVEKIVEKNKKTKKPGMASKLKFWSRTKQTPEINSPAVTEPANTIAPMVNNVVDTTINSLPPKNVTSSVSHSSVPDTAQKSSYVSEKEITDEPNYSDEPDDLNELDNSTVKPVTSNKPAITNSTLRQGQRENFVNEFEDFVTTKIVPKVPGLALAIIADGKVKVLQGYGEKRTGGHDPVNADTVFRLASVSKTIASTAAAVMVRDGKINWDTTLNSVIPEVTFSNPKYGDKLTVRDIMSQATGLPTHTYTHLIEANMPFAEAVSRLHYINFVCPPGKCYAYQNVTFSLISNIILKKTGTPYDKYVGEKLFKPLGMTSASFGLAGLQATHNFAQPHVMGNGRWMATDIEENYYHIYPAAGANASITDMSHWVLAQMGHNPEVLPSETLKRLHEKITRNTPAQSHYGANIGATDTHYGLGWRIFDYRGDKNFVHHGGWVKGFRSEVVFNQDLQIGMVLLTNSETKLARNIIFKFLDAYEDEKHGKQSLAAELMPMGKRRK